MKRKTRFSIQLFIQGVFVLIPIVLWAQKIKPNKAFISLLQGDKAFQSDLINRGQRLAFLDVLSENSLVFRPEVTDGISYYLKSNKFQGTLTWEAAWAEISKDGYFGYTTGPYRYLIDDTTHYGEYLSIWLKDPFKTKWKLFVNGGTRHGKPTFPKVSVSYPAVSTDPYPTIYPGLIEQSKDILLSTDILFSTLMSTRSQSEAYEDYLTPDARWLEDGQFPVKGRDSILYNMSLHKGYLVLRPSASFVCYSNDMGFTHGTGDFVDINRKTHRDKKFSYLRIWRLAEDGLWRIALEIRMKKD